MLLKLDLQGYELEALMGATETLARTRWVLFETGFRKSYEGEPDFVQILDFLRERNFRFVRPLDILRAQNGEIIQMDALFESSAVPRQQG